MKKNKNYLYTIFIIGFVLISMFYVLINREKKESNVSNETTTVVSSTETQDSNKKTTTTKNTTTTTTKRTTTKKTTTTATPLKGSVNRTVSCPDFDFTVVSYNIKKKGTRIDSFTKVGDPEWIGIIVKAKNTSNKEIHVYSSDIELENANGEIISPSFITRNIWGGYKLFNSPKLRKGGTATGYLQYSNTNKNNKGLSIRVNCNDGDLFKDDTVKTITLTYSF